MTADSIGYEVLSKMKLIHWFCRACFDITPEALLQDYYYSRLENHALHQTVLFIATVCFLFFVWPQNSSDKLLLLFSINFPPKPSPTADRAPRHSKWIGGRPRICHFYCTNQSNHAATKNQKGRSHYRDPPAATHAHPCH